MIKRNTLLAKTSPQLNVIFKSGYKKTWKFRVKAKRERRMVRRTKLYDLFIHRLKFICKKIKISAKKNTAQEISFPLRISWSHLLKNSSMKNLIFCAVNVSSPT